ncbi:hypothetical protein [Bradyrhizobium sp. 63_E2_N1_3]|uniref:hypothetical protein n=1 Tax=Bradyrhizobium sp. 63_E2_N1_3 TaxID=3240373 RepID=UPI003F8C94BE
MVMPFNISRDRWSLKEIIMDEGDRPGRGGFAFVLDDEHFPYFQYPKSRDFADALKWAAVGKPSSPIDLATDGSIQVSPTSSGDVAVRTPAGATRNLSASEAQCLAKDLISPLAQTIAS